MELVKRVFSEEFSDVYESVDWKKVDVEIKDWQTGEVIYEGHDLEFPEDYSQQACDIIASKYFYRNIDGNGTPETSLKQVAHRMARFWTEALIEEELLDGWFKYEFAVREPKNIFTGDAGIFYDEIVWTLLHQMWAPNSPQWFNTGICYYGIEGDPDDFYYFDDEGLHKSKDRYSRSQTSACFIIPAEDRLIGKDSITDHYVTETKLFKGGSGVGTNFSKIRAEGEKLSSGGESSGVMSFLLGLDRNAGAIKSGGTTRRAAKMVILDIDHPDIEEFIDWKVKEEKKARDLISLGYDGSMGGEAYSTVSGQNSNNSVRVDNEFMNKVLKGDKDTTYWLLGREDMSLNRSVDALELWDKIAKAAWECADPGIQFDDRYNEWNTCATDGWINATNPCSEFAFLDNSACNLASINLTSLFDETTNRFEMTRYRHLITLCQMVLEASIHWGHYPTEDVAYNSYRYRPTGLGFCNLGSLLIKMGMPYDSDDARQTAKSLAGVLTAQSYLTSAEMAKRVEPCDGFHDNRKSMLAVLRKHLMRANVDSVEEDLFEQALRHAEDYGVRNMQTTVMAPTGTISLAMDCESTGIEPVFSHKMFKKCADGSVMEITNPLVEDYLLGYNGADLDEVDYIRAQNYFDDHGTYQGCGMLTEHEQAVLATANEISPEGHVLMMAAIQPMISGSISKTVNLPNSATVEDIKRIYELAYTSGCKSISIYRDGSKGTQPLNVSIDEDEDPCGGVDLPHKKRIDKPAEMLFNIEDGQTFCVQTEDGETTLHSNMALDYYVFEGDEEGAIKKVVADTVTDDTFDYDVMDNSPTVLEELPYTYNEVKKEGATVHCELEIGDNQNVLIRSTEEFVDIESSKPFRFDPEIRESDYFMGIEQPKEILVSLHDNQDVSIQTRHGVTGIGSNMPLDFTVPNEHECGQGELERKKPDGMRTGRTHTFKIGDVELYITVSYYDNGDLCEVFVSSDREGTTTKGLLSSLSKSISHMLQYGIPPESIATMLRNQQYEPAGHVERHPYIKMATSISDIIARVIEFEDGNYSRCQVSPLDDIYGKGCFECEDNLEDKDHEEERFTEDEPVQINVTVSPELAADSVYTGSECAICHSTRMVRNGTCEVCLDCGNTSGCS